MKLFLRVAVGLGVAPSDTGVHIKPVQICRLMLSCHFHCRWKDVSIVNPGWSFHSLTRDALILTPSRNFKLNAYFKGLSKKVIVSVCVSVFTSVQRGT